MYESGFLRTDKRPDIGSITNICREPFTKRLSQTKLFLPRTIICVTPSKRVRFDFFKWDPVFKNLPTSTGSRALGCNQLMFNHMHSLTEALGNPRNIRVDGKG